MTLHRYEMFTVETITVNGQEFEFCFFHRCKLVAHAGGAPCRMNFNELKDCELVGNGWPPVLFTIDEKGVHTHQ